jgi:hypothetical protein
MSCYKWRRKDGGGSKLRRWASPAPYHSNHVRLWLVAHKAARRVSSSTVQITRRDQILRTRAGCRGTNTGCIPVQCVLSGHSRTASAQVERLERPGSPPFLRGFWVRALGAPPAKTSLIDLASWDECLVPRNTAYLAYERGIRSRKVIASSSHRNQIDAPMFVNPGVSGFCACLAGCGGGRGWPAGRCRGSRG